MYSEKIICQVLAGFEQDNGWMPKARTLGQVQEFDEYIKSITDVTSNERTTMIDFKPGLRITEQRKKEIIHWVRNEQFMCFADARYFISRYAYICNEGGDIFQFQLRKSQEIFLQILEWFDDLQVAIELFCLKARQLGISTLVAVLFLHRLLFIPNTQGVMASVRQQNSELLARMIETCWQRLPFWLVPLRTSPKIEAMKWNNNSILSLQTGSQKMGIAQGWTPQCIHISEVADIPNPKKVLEEGLFPAMHATRKLFAVLEGTGSDSNLWQKEKWKYYKENWGKGGRFLPLFLPWPCATDLYPPADWIKKNPIPEGWTPLPETRKMKTKAELYIRSNEALSRVMGARWIMPREQAWFWETKYREAVNTHTLKTMLSQFPCSDEEAFQNKNDTVFNDATMERIEVSAARELPYTAYAVTGQSVLIGQDDHPYEPDPEAIDYEKERITITWKSNAGQTYRWELIPLLPFDDSDDTQCFNKLLVFKEPQVGCDYSIGVDTADGLGNPDEDRSLLNVTLNRQGNERDEQVAELVSNEINPPQMVSFAAAMATWYGQWSGGTAGTKDSRGVKFCIEQRMRFGDDCYYQLKLMGFTFHHKMVRYDDAKVDLNKSNKGGWFTNVWSRPILTNRFVDAISNGWYLSRSPMLLRQLGTWVRKTDGGGKSRLDHDTGQHDDNIMAAAMAYFTRHQADILAQRQQQKYEAPDEKELKISFDYLQNTITL